MNLLNLQIKESISKLFPVSLEIQAHYLLNGKLKVYKKGEIILRQGIICDKMMYVYKGFLRAYIVNNKKEKVTTWFKGENSFLTIMNSYIKNKPSLFTIEAIENTYIVVFEKSFIDKMTAKYPEIALIYTQHLEKYFMEIENHAISLQALDAKSRYDELLEGNPNILLRAPLGQIASYLGITQSTLSRLRAKKN
jgi:CRP/FNR family transcriptional regulator, anaerobic regulatory protein